MKRRKNFNPKVKEFYNNTFFFYCVRRDEKCFNIRNTKKNRETYYNNKNILRESKTKHYREGFSKCKLKFNLSNLLEKQLNFVGISVSRNQIKKMQIKSWSINKRLGKEHFILYYLLKYFFHENYNIINSKELYIAHIFFNKLYRIDLYQIAKKFIFLISGTTF
nr:hypothetical protein 1634Bnrm3_p017 [Cryptomonas sp.]